MKLRALVLVVATGLACSVRAQSAPPASQPSADSSLDLRQQVQEMRVEMAKMKLHEQALEEKIEEQALPSSPSDAETVAATIRDADMHTQRMSQELMIGSGFDPSKGFVIASEDGNFVMHPVVLVQVRYDANYRQHANTDGSSDTQSGFEIRRLQIGFDGNVYSPDITYRLFIQTERSDGQAALFDAWIKYHFHGTPWYIEGGQFKAPFAHEQLVFDRTLLAAERTLTDDILASGEAFSQGVMGIYDPNGALRVKADFTNGYGVNNVNFEEYPFRPSNFGMGARGEYKFSGQWKDYDQFTSLGDKHDLLVAGAGVDWTEGNTADAIRQAADVQWNHGGLGLFGGYIGRYIGRNGSAGATLDAGAVAQISYLMSGNHLEFFGRYDFLRLDGKEFTTKTKSNVHEITAGANYYFYGQNLKLTLDVTYLPNGSPVDDNGSGVLLDNGHAEGVFRAQAQLAI